MPLTTADLLESLARAERDRAAAAELAIKRNDILVWMCARYVELKAETDRLRAELRTSEDSALMDWLDAHCWSTELNKDDGSRKAFFSGDPVDNNGGLMRSLVRAARAEAKGKAT